MMGPRFAILITNRKSDTRFRWCESQWSWTASTHSIARHVLLAEHITKIWMVIDSYYRLVLLLSVEKCGLETSFFRQYTWGWLKKVICILWWIFQQSRTIFLHFFTVTLSRKSAIKRLSQTSPHLKSVTTLPCKILTFTNRTDRKYGNGRPGVRMLKRMWPR